MLFEKYQYIYPPRPEQKISADKLRLYDNGTYIAQPKYNGTNCVVFLGDGVKQIMNRHHEEISNPFFSEIDYAGLRTCKGFVILCGELLNKNQSGEDGSPFNKKLVLWDILCYDSQYLIGETTEARLHLLEELFPCNRGRVSLDKGLECYEHICCTNVKGVYKAPTYTDHFLQLYNELVQTDLYEGVVLKRAGAKLSVGYTQKNNHDWQLKARKETKSYKF